MTYREDLWNVAASNHGIVTTRQADDVGVPAVEVRKLAARGALERLAHGVYRHKGVPADEHTELAAALAAAGDDAFLDAVTVLAVLNLALVNPPKIYIGKPDRHRTALPPHTEVVRRRMPEDDLTTHDGLRGVTAHRALRDAVGVVMSDRLHAAVDEALARDLIDDLEAADIRGTIAAHARDLNRDRDRDRVAA